MVQYQGLQHQGLDRTFAALADPTRRDILDRLGRGPASISELAFRSRDFAWHPERVSLVSFNSIHHLPAELHTEY